MRRGILKLFGVGAMLIASAAFAADAPPQYVLTDLGTLTGEHGYSTAYGLNNLGQVVGQSVDSQGNRKPFLFSNGVMQDLGSFGGFSGAADAINDAGQIVGWSDTSPNPDAPANWHAFLVNGIGAPMQDIGLSAILGYQYRQYSINNSGQVVGPNGYSSVIYSDGAIRQTFRLPLESGLDQTAATAINNHSVVTGWADSITAGHQQGFVFSGGGFTLLADASFYANGINDSGYVVGALAMPNGDLHAYVYDGTTTKDLGTLGITGSSEAEAINSQGEIVGWSELAAHVGPDYATVIIGGTTYDLNKFVVSGPSGWQLGEATAINDLGQIVGIMGDGADAHAFMLTPTPEPTFLGIGLITAVGLLNGRPSRSAFF